MYRQLVIIALIVLQDIAFSEGLVDSYIDIATSRICCIKRKWKSWLSFRWADGACQHQSDEKRQIFVGVRFCECDHRSHYKTTSHLCNRFNVTEEAEIWKFKLPYKIKIVAVLVFRSFHQLFLFLLLSEWRAGVLCDVMWCDVMNALVLYVIFSKTTWEKMVVE